MKLGKSKFFKTGVFNINIYKTFTDQSKALIKTMTIYFSKKN